MRIVSTPTFFKRRSAPAARGASLRIHVSAAGGREYIDMLAGFGGRPPKKRENEDEYLTYKRGCQRQEISCVSGLWVCFRISPQVNAI